MFFQYDVLVLNSKNHILCKIIFGLTHISANAWYICSKLSCVNVLVFRMWAQTIWTTQLWTSRKTSKETGGLWHRESWSHMLCTLPPDRLVLCDNLQIRFCFVEDMAKNKTNKICIQVVFVSLLLCHCLFYLSTFCWRGKILHLKYVDEGEVNGLTPIVKLSFGESLMLCCGRVEIHFNRKRQHCVVWAQLRLKSQGFQALQEV